MKKLAIVSLAAIIASDAFAVDHRSFGKIADTNAQSIVYAPSALIVDGIYTGEALLTTNNYWDAGWRTIVDVVPQVDSNHYAVATGWANRADHWLDRVYEIKQNPPPPPRRFYKYDMSAACLEFEFLDQYMAFINSNEKIKWFYNDAEILVETDPYFIAGTNLAVQSGIITDAKVKQILDRAYELGQSMEVSK